MKLTHVRAIARKEIYHLLRDYRSLILAFAIPLVLILLFGYALSLDVDNVGTVIVDQDNTDLSRDFVRHMEASSYFRIVGRTANTRELPAWLDEGRATLAVVIGPGWTRDMRSDREAAIQVLLDGSDPNFAGIARGYITAFTERYNRDRLSRFLDRQGRDSLRPPVEGRIRVWFNEDLESRNFIIPGIIALIIMIVAAMLTALVIAREYENGTMETIKSLPVTAGELLTGKSIPYFFIALADVLVAILMGQVLFGIVMKGSFPLLILASSLYILVALTLGLLISTVTKSQLVANQGAILVTYLPSLLLSDFVFPVTNMPSVLQFLTSVVPATYYIDVLNGIYLRRLGLAQLWPDLAVLAVMFAVLAVANVLLLRREGL